MTNYITHQEWLDGPNDEDIGKDYSEDQTDSDLEDIQDNEESGNDEE